ncbi:MAG TPA: GAF domain-containing protein [Clostridia bacterium]
MNPDKFKENNIIEHGQLNAAELERLNEELKREVLERKRTEEQLEQRTRLLSTLLDVSNIVSSTMEFKTLMEAILDRLKSIFDYTGAGIFILEGSKLRLIAQRGQINDKIMEECTFKLDEVPLVRDIILEKKPAIVPDTQDNVLKESSNGPDKSGKDALACFGRSWMGLPLVMKERILGLLCVGNEKPGFYRHKDISLGMAFAGQAAIEFENVRLYNETSKKADELKTMLAVQQAITSRLDKDSVLQLIADESKRLTGSERAAVFMVEGADLVLSVFSGKDSRKFLGYTFPAAGSVMGRSVMAGKSLILNSSRSKESAFYMGLVNEAGAKSFLCVPLISNGGPIGAIAAVDKTTGEFGDDDERILSLLATSAVIGLENSRLYQEEQKRHIEDKKRRRVAESLRDILKVLNSNLQINEIQDFILSQALLRLDADAGAFYHIGSDNGILKVEASKGLPAEYAENFTAVLGKGVVGKAVSTHEPIVVKDNSFLGEDGNPPSLLWLADNFKVQLAVPLICMDEIYGGIALYYKNDMNFTHGEIDLAMAFAGQAALAIDNARLRAKSQETAVAAERSRLARDLHDSVTQTLFSASLIADALPLIWLKSSDQGKKHLEELRQLTRGALAEMRTLLLELRPATLAETGLKELLTQLVQAFSGRSRIPVNLSIRVPAQVSPDVKIAFYRIAQETLNNIAKYSDASVVEFELAEDENENLMLKIRDNGRGFDKSKVSPGHLGLGIMKERAEAIGAQLSIESCLGEGTEVMLMLKICEGEKSDAR